MESTGTETFQQEGSVSVVEDTYETQTTIYLPSGALRVDYSADLGDLLVSLLLFTLLAVQCFRWVSDSLRERRGE